MNFVRPTFLIKEFVTFLLVFLLKNNFMHTNEVFAYKKRFVGKLIHGAILAIFLSHFMDCLSINKCNCADLMN